MSTNNPLKGKSLYIDPYNSATTYADGLPSSRADDAKIIHRIGRAPSASWVGDWTSNPARSIPPPPVPVQLANLDAYVRQTCDRSAAQGQMAGFVIYNIPYRDCGGFSAGTTDDPDFYKQWITTFANAVNSRSAYVVVEPDALPQWDCLTGAQRAERLGLLNFVIDTFIALPKAVVYIDIGHPHWLRNVADAVGRLAQITHLNQARGFSLNTSNYVDTPACLAYGDQIVAGLAAQGINSNFIIDTSRNGNGAAPGDEWCNPPGRALGILPQIPASLPSQYLDAFAWTKRPGESDGFCYGSPAAGEFWDVRALEMAKNAGWTATNLPAELPFDQSGTVVTPPTTSTWPVVFSEVSLTRPPNKSLTDIVNVNGAASTLTLDHPTNALTQAWTTSEVVQPETPLINPKSFLNTYWDFNPVSNGYDTMESIITPEVDSVDGYFFGHSWLWNNYTKGAYMGLQTAAGHTGAIANQKIAIFSVWDVSVATSTGVVVPFSTEGTGMSCRIPYAWVAGHSYKVKVAVTGTSGSDTIWSATVTDVATGVATTIGNVNVPTVRQKIKDGNCLTFHERYTGPTGAITDLSPSKVKFTNVRANTSVLPIRQVNYPGSITGFVGNYYYENIVDGVHSAVGYPNRQHLTLNGPNLTGVIDQGPAIIGDYVKAGTVGANYTSPGYTSTPPPSTPGWTLVNTVQFANLSDFWDPYEGPGNPDGAGNPVGTRDPATVSVLNGELRITAHGTIGGGVQTKYLRTYGRWEVRARMERGAGFGPAILLMRPDDIWPPEIDITEMPEGNRQTSHFTIHYDPDQQQTEHTDSGDFTQWHTYTVDWLADKIVFYLDGIERYRTTDRSVIPAASPLCLSIQVDIGPNDYIEGPDSNTPSTCTLHVDSVKVYAPT